MPPTPRLETHLTGHEFWLLSQCVASPFPLHHLLYEKVHEVTNSRDQKMHREEVVAALRAMASKGCVMVLSPLAKTPPRSRRVTKAEQIVCFAEAECREYELSGPGSRSWLHLTAKGARTWEEFARPDWSRLLQDNFVDRSTGTITCQDLHWLEEFVRVYSAWTGTHFESVVRRIGRWRPTYWKALPDGYRASLRSTGGKPVAWSQEAGKAVNYMSNYWRMLASGF